MENDKPEEMTDHTLLFTIDWNVERIYRLETETEGLLTEALKRGLYMPNESAD